MLFFPSWSKPHLNTGKHLLHIPLLRHNWNPAGRHFQFRVPNSDMFKFSRAGFKRLSGHIGRVLSRRRPSTFLKIKFVYLLFTYLLIVLALSKSHMLVAPEPGYIIIFVWFNRQLAVKAYSWAKSSHFWSIKTLLFFPLYILK